LEGGQRIPLGDEQNHRTYRGCLQRNGGCERLFAPEIILSYNISDWSVNMKKVVVVLTMVLGLFLSPAADGD